MFHELLCAVMVSVFTLLHGFKGSYIKSVLTELINLVSQKSQLLKPYISDMVLDVLPIAESGQLECFVDFGSYMSIGLVSPNIS